MAAGPTIREISRACTATWKGLNRTLKEAGLYLQRARGADSGIIRWHRGDNDILLVVSVELIRASNGEAALVFRVGEPMATVPVTVRSGREVVLYAIGTLKLPEKARSPKD